MPLQNTQQKIILSDIYKTLTLIPWNMHSLAMYYTLGTLLVAEIKPNERNLRKINFSPLCTFSENLSSKYRLRQSMASITRVDAQPSAGGGVVVTLLMTMIVKRKKKKKIENK